ncbi:MAG TPA: glycosyltransferase family 9 protein [Ktedonosporobacter sp.]|nr:glycosyltransferase family 9 protein [Ktedonosporobacter sp.]
MHLLVIRPGAIGDALLALPVIQALRLQRGYVQVRLVTNTAILPLARASRLVDKTFDYGDPRWSELFSTSGIDGMGDMLELINNVDTAICWLRDPDGLVERNLRAQGIPQVIVAPGRPAENEHVHIVEHLARTVGIDPPGPFVFGFSPPPPQGDRKGSPLLYSEPNAYPCIVGAIPCSRPACGRPDGCGRPFPDAPIAIHPGSGGARKCWPIASFAAVIRALWQRETPVLLLAGPADRERLATLMSMIAQPPRPTLLKLLVDLPLLELAQHLQLCRGYLGNDSGITHLASMLGIPTLALFGPSDPLIWRPCGPRVQLIHQPDLEHLPVDEVMGTLEL